MPNKYAVKLEDEFDEAFMIRLWNALNPPIIGMGDACGGKWKASWVISVLRMLNPVDRVQIMRWMCPDGWAVCDEGPDEQPGLSSYELGYRTGWEDYAREWEARLATWRLPASTKNKTS